MLKTPRSWVLSHYRAVKLKGKTPGLWHRFPGTSVSHSGESYDNLGSLRLELVVGLRGSTEAGRETLEHPRPDTMEDKEIQMGFRKWVSIQDGAFEEVLEGRWGSATRRVFRWSHCMSQCQDISL